MMNKIFNLIATKDNISRNNNAIELIHVKLDAHMKDLKKRVTVYLTLTKQHKLRHKLTAQKTTMLQMKKLKIINTTLHDIYNMMKYTIRVVVNSLLICRLICNTRSN